MTPNNLRERSLGRIVPGSPPLAGDMLILTFQGDAFRRVSNL